MKKNRSVQKLLVFLLLAITVVGNTASYQQVVQKGNSYDVQVYSQKKSNGLDLGKAD